MNAGKEYKKTIRKVAKAERDLAANNEHTLTRDDFAVLAKKSGMLAQLQLLQGRVRAADAWCLPQGGAVHSTALHLTACPLCAASAALRCGWTTDVG